ncbi:hypothetical protein ACWGQT_06005 [Streptomyces yangpuensis]
MNRRPSVESPGHRPAEDGRSPEAVVEYVRPELVGLLGLRGCRFAVAPAAQAGSALDTAGLAHRG